MTEGEYIGGTDGKEEYWLTDEPIVRCRYCKSWATEHHFFGGSVGKEFNPDRFCSWGKRKGADNEQAKAKRYSV